MAAPQRRRKDREPQNQVVGTSATVSTAIGDGLNSVVSLAIEPIHEDIARHAYQLYEARGGEHGHDFG